MIIEARQILADALAPMDWPVYGWEPANADLVPCLVVGRPTFEVQGTGAGNLYTITNPVWVIGRRLGDEDSAAELDVVTDDAIALVAKVSSVVAVLPTIRTIAEVSYPAYRIDCVTGEGRC